jgi:hypothetical protein
MSDDTIARNSLSINFQTAQSLFRQLKSYGLNPYDWKIERTSTAQVDSIRMQHRADEQFRFHGRVSRSETGELQLRHLALASL